MKKILLFLAYCFILIPINRAQIITTLAGTGSQGSVNATGTAASFFAPIGITVVSGNFFIGDKGNNLIRKITPAGVVTTFAGSGTAGLVNGTGTAASFFGPGGLCADASGNIYVADTYNNVIRKITTSGVVTTLAGSTAGYADGSGTSAQFNGPSNVICDVSNNVYVSDQNNQRIRKITAAGVVSTVAGSGAMGFTNGTGTAATFKYPAGIGYNVTTGDLFIADQGNNCIRRITSAGVVSTFAGSATSGTLDATGTAARFFNPAGLHLDGPGNIYVADYANNMIRKITTSGVVTTITGIAGQGFVNGNASVAEFYNPIELRFYNNSIYVADFHNHSIRQIDPCPSPSFPANATPNATVCSGSSTTLSAIGSYTIQWYANATATNAIATGANYITTNTLAIGAYTLYVEDISPCSNTTTAGLRMPIEFSVVCCSVPAPPVNTTGSSNTVVCAGNSATLSASSAGNISWYASASGGVTLSSGSTFITSNTLSPGSYTMYAEGTSSCSISASRTPIIFQVNCCGAPNVPLNTTPVSNATICAGNSTTLSVSGIGTINWYSSPTGGASTATGTNYITPGILPVGVYTIYAEAATSCSVSASRTAITFTVISCCFAPDPPQNVTSVSNAQVCAGMSAILTATSNGTISWFITTSGGSAISTGSMYTTSNALPVGAYTYYAEAASSCSINPARAAVTFTIIDCTATGLNALQNKVLIKSVYPNPNDGIFILELTNHDLKTIEVLDITGRILLTTNTTDASVNYNLNTFSNGIYYIKIRSSENVDVIKVLKH